MIVPSQYMFNYDK